MSTSDRDVIGLVPVAGVLAYPFLLDAFHAMVGPAGTEIPVSRIAAAAVLLAGAFAVPAPGILIANRAVPCKPSMRRLAYLSVAAPTLYVFLGVVNYMARSAYPDELLWCLLWLGLAGWAWFGRSRVDDARPDVARGRIAHGIVAALVLVYVLFHLCNHLYFLAGTEAYMRVMHLGERVYRAQTVEMLLVSAMLFMCMSGAWLAWCWSGADSRHDFFRTFQIASGVFLLMYIIGHMDSVFIYARLYLGAPTDWRFATGAPAGMIHDAWNIRLLPHYALGVFFVLAHATTGLRGILLAHGASRRLATAIWGGGVALGAGVATAIIIGMCSVV